MELRWEIWLEQLCNLANQRGIDLNLNRYSYHTYFMRGWLPESVVDEVAEMNKQPGGEV